MPRLRLVDVRENLPSSAIGMCSSDLALVAKLTNKAQRRLVYAREAGETGWWGSWSEMAFNVSQSSPSLTLPRDVARLINLTVCKRPVNIQNQFYEYLDFGVGPQPAACSSVCNYLEIFTRNIVPTFVDLTPPNKKVRVYPTDPNDQGKRTFLSGLDNNGNNISGLDNGILCNGAFLTLTAPFSDFPMEISHIGGIQKDPTFGPVKYYEVDMTTGDQTLLLTMEAGEKVASYRRYFINGLPKNCCNPPSGSPDTVQVTAMAKLDLVDVYGDTDYLLIQNLEALYQEFESIRHSEMDNSEAKQLSAVEHQQAIRHLQAELVHYVGKKNPAIGFMNAERSSLQAVNAGMI